MPIFYWSRHMPEAFESYELSEVYQSDILVSVVLDILDVRDRGISAASDMPLGNLPEGQGHNLSRI